MKIRMFETKDAEEVCDLIIHTLRTTNIKDESIEEIEKVVRTITPESIIERASFTNFYLFEDNFKIIATGAIGPYWGSETESSLFTIFVSPQYQGRGIGKLIIETLENDYYFKSAKRIEIPASVTAVQFYRKYGYDFKDGIKEKDDEGIHRMEKFR
ncbi:MULTISPECIES: GNAT family N-acetyltransferase [Mammaliicoccus]|uniref:GNAT family N-acetyltransferase n=1 Tax=Mammaliicoccus TaxID=2803850 RepID=UPI000D1C8638|nr:MULTISPECIES: GNAT family N-acetyltransferase [Mammaliicoccus]HCN60565.1 GNAT family N-acetyltransferase [Staphylococcus sp.]MBW0765946.1 GNAT family N-acetyltransferase [Mammaliicoccus fleurettii]PTE35334.1 GNAT family N-acetyltransferase [Mammaliicoccus fleurettii]RIL50880.1 GNAT family N-acetyltransferase [Mammaliicoccus fleurettii]RTX87946.1 GNAT family N-acetyltransferase [Mammaliicoccus fleurettii]